MDTGGQQVVEVVSPADGASTGQRGAGQCQGWQRHLPVTRSLSSCCLAGYGCSTWQNTGTIVIAGNRSSVVVDSYCTFKGMLAWLQQLADLRYHTLHQAHQAAAWQGPDLPALHCRAGEIGQLSSVTRSSRAEAPDGHSTVAIAW